MQRTLGDMLVQRKLDAVPDVDERVNRAAHGPHQHLSLASKEILLDDGYGGRGVAAVVGRVRRWRGRDEPMEEVEVIGVVAAGIDRVSDRSTDGRRHIRDAPLVSKVIKPVCLVNLDGRHRGHRFL